LIVTFGFPGGECASAIPDIRPAVEPGGMSPNAAEIDLVRLFALDNRPAARRRLVCHWRRQPDGRLACIWQPDLVR
jgi:hypothetical protein